MSSLGELSVQVLVVFLYEGKGGDGGGSGEISHPGGGARGGGYNVFRMILSNMSLPHDLEFCFKGFSRLLSNLYQSADTYLPGSIAKIQCHQEVLILLWKFLEVNEHFVRYIFNEGPPSESSSGDYKPDINELVIPICYILLTHRTSASSRSAREAVRTPAMATT